MIGNGTPSSQSSAPLPRSMICLLLSQRQMTLDRKESSGEALSRSIMAAPPEFRGTNEEAASFARFVCMPPCPRRAALQLDHAAPCRMRHRVGAAGGVELVEDRADMKFRGMHGYAEPPGDRLVGGALGHQRQHVELARREIGLGGLDAIARIACHDRNACCFSRRCKAQTCDGAEQRRQPVSQGAVADFDRDDDWRGRLIAHVSGLSPIVTLKRAGSPPRLTATSTTEPTLSGPSARSSARTLERDCSFQPTMTSPCLMPALAEGPALSMLITIAPTPSSSLIGCRPSPRYPRAIRPWLSSLGATRSIVAEE